MRVLRYRQHKRDGTVIQAEWLTNFSIDKLGSLSFYRMAKSRWEIEMAASTMAKTAMAWSISVTTSPTAS